MLPRTLVTTAAQRAAAAAASNNGSSASSSSMAAMPIYLSGAPRIDEHADSLAVLDKASASSLQSPAPAWRHVALASAADVDVAIAAAACVAAETAAMPLHARRAVLLEVARGIEARHAVLADAIVHEVGKPLAAARVEVSRAVDTFTLAAEEVGRAVAGGDFVDMASMPRADGWTMLSRRLPLGVLSFITPFNFPLNLVAHKVAPAIAAGCPWILKPADKSPVSSLLLAEILAGSTTQLPTGSWHVLPAQPGDAQAMVTDPRIRCLSFTGSVDVGWQLAAMAGPRKRVVLELGGNAAVVVDETKTVEERTAAAAAIAGAAFASGGQTCISVQRVFVHHAVADAFRADLVAAAGKLRVGDATDPDVAVGLLINPESAVRVRAWVDEAVAGGARVVYDGNDAAASESSLVAPIILEDVPADARVDRSEVFGPVLVLRTFGDDFDAVLDAVNDSPFGLQAGVFTNDLHRAFRAYERLEVGAVVINDVPTTRLEAQAYGGVKDSGVGREGLTSAIRDFTEERVMLMKRKAY